MSRKYICFVILAGAIAFSFSCKKHESFFMEDLFFDFSHDWKQVEEKTFPEYFEKSCVSLFNWTYNEIFKVDGNSQFRFKLKLPSIDQTEKLILSFNYGILKPYLGKEFFTIAVDNEEVFRKSVNTKANPDCSFPADFSGKVDLSGFAGKTVSISFTTGKEEDGQTSTNYWWNIKGTKLKSKTREYSSEEKPNILLIVVDALRKDHLGFNGYKKNTSPNIDSIAGKSIVFDNAFSTSAWSLPAGTNMFTGCNSLKKRASVSSELFYADNKFTTMAEFFQNNGFTTLGISANPLISPKYNLAQGFELFSSLPLDTNAEEIRTQFDDWLSKYGKYRFFSTLWFMDVHTPSCEKDPFILTDNIDYEKCNEAFDYDFYTTDEDNPFKGKMVLDNYKTIYDNEISYIDRIFAKIISDLKKRNLLNKTIIVFTADHGDAFNEHQNWFHGTSVYNEVTHIPLFIYFPGSVKGQRSEKLMSIIDIFPTVAELAGTPVSDTVEGIDILSESNNDILISAHFGKKNNQEGEIYSLIEKNWKLIDFDDIGGGVASELYNLAEDMEEKNELSEQFPEKFKFMKLKLRSILTNMKTDAFKNEKKDKETLRILRSLGYI